jgi:hypothetical protein
MIFGNSVVIALSCRVWPARQLLGTIFPMFCLRRNPITHPWKEVLERDLFAASVLDTDRSMETAENAEAGPTECT